MADVLADDGSAEGGDEKPVILGQSLTEETYRRIHEERSGENEAVHRENVQSSSSQGAGQMASSYQFSVTTPLAYGPQAFGFVLARLLGLGSLGLCIWDVCLICSFCSRRLFDLKAASLWKDSRICRISAAHEPPSGVFFIV